MHLEAWIDRSRPFIKMATGPINVCHRSSSTRGTHRRRTTPRSPFVHPSQPRRASRLHARCPHKLLPQSSQRAWIERSRPHIMRPSCWPHLCSLTSPMSSSPSPSSDARTLLLEPAIAPSAHTTSMHRSPELAAHMHAPSELPSPARRQHWQRRDDRRFCIEGSRNSCSARCYSASSHFL
ncbi:hypothetical protein ACLOJK_028906 [Asimina triloba]